MKKQIIAVLALACVGLSACGNTAESAEPKTTSAAETTTTTTAETTAETTTTEPTTTTAETTTTQATTTETPEPESDMMTVEECLQMIVKEKYEDEIYNLGFTGYKDNHFVNDWYALENKKEYIEYYNNNDVVGNNCFMFIYFGHEEESINLRDKEYTKVYGLNLYDSLMKEEPVNIKCFARYDCSPEVFYDGLNESKGIIGYNPFVLDEKKEYTVEEFVKKIYGDDDIIDFEGHIDKYFNKNESFAVSFDKYYDESHNIFSTHFYGISSLDEKINIDYLFCIGEGIFIYAPDAEYFYQ